MTANTETVNAIASAIVSALIDRLVSDDSFINGVAERVGRVGAEEVDKKITVALAELIDSSDLDRKITDTISSADLVDEDGVDERIEKYLQGYEVDADSIKGLESFVDSIVDDKIDGMEVDADNVSGLGDTIESKVEEAMNNFEVEASTVSGLNNTVSMMVAEIIVDKVLDSLSDDVVKKNICAVVENGVELTTHLTAR